MKALVTGASGLVGSHVAQRLIELGLEVACLVRPSSRRTWLEGLAVEYRTGSMNDEASLSLAITGVDYVFHCAGLMRARKLEEFLAVNAEGTRRLAQAAAWSTRKVRRFVYVSSLAAVGPAPTPVPVDETTPPRPLDFYGQSKLAGEQALLAFAPRLPVTIIRPPAVYGPPDTNFLPFFRLARKWRIAPLLGGPDKQISFAHARDLAEGICQAGLAEAAIGQTYFIASSTCTTAEFVRALGAGLGFYVRPLIVPAWLAKLAGEWGELKWKLTGRPQILSRRKVRDALQDRWTCCWDKARRELGYQEKITMEAGLAQTAKWYREKGWI